MGDIYGSYNCELCGFTIQSGYQCHCQDTDTQAKTLVNAMTPKSPAPGNVERAKRFMDAGDAYREAWARIQEKQRALDGPSNIRELKGVMGTGQSSDDWTISLWFDNKPVLAFSNFRDALNFSVLVEYGGDLLAPTPSEDAVAEAQEILRRGLGEFRPHGTGSIFEPDAKWLARELKAAEARGIERAAKLILEEFGGGVVGSKYAAMIRALMQL